MMIKVILDFGSAPSPLAASHRNGDQERGAKPQASRHDVTQSKIQNPKSKIATIILLAVLLTPGGCNIVGPAAYLAEGPPKVDAQHVLADVPTLVFVDDRKNHMNPISLRRVIADKASEELMVKKVLAITISPQDAIAIARRNETAHSVMPIEEIGKAVGASQVIYIEMLQFTDTPDGFTPRPMAACRVKVIDVESRTRVFPDPASGEPARLVQVMTREIDPDLYTTIGGRLKVFEGLAIATGAEVAKLFYRHEARELGGSLNPR